MIDSATVDRIFAAANIVDVIGDFVTLKKKGTNFQACCPFHNEKTPSFMVSPSKGLFKCFGCGKGGNAVTFVMEHEHVSYVEALRYVAKKYGIEVEERPLSEEDKKRNDDRESMLRVSGYAQEFFVNQLHETPEGKSVGLSYFRERGFTEQTIRKFQLGFCSTTGDALSQSALKAGYREEYLVGTGLSIKRDNGTYYDRFTGRVIFPIHAVSGSVIAFGGRILRTDKKTAKYLNSPESEIYHKSNVLYGIYFAKNAIAREDNCILVEGYTDVISLHQSGIEQVVASSGTSLTEGQIQLISRFTKNVTVIYDGDAAGVNASLRGIDMLLKEGLNVRVVPLPASEDPDSFARSHTAAELNGYLKEHAEDFISFKVRILLNEAQHDPIKRAGVIRDIVESIAVIPDRISRSVYIRECSRTMEIEPELLEREVLSRRHTQQQTQESREEREQLHRLEVQWEHREQSGTEEPPCIPNALIGCGVLELEREVVGCLVKYGDLNFECRPDGEQELRSFNVARTIIGELEADGIRLQHPEMAEVYDRYVGLFKEHRAARVAADMDDLDRGDSPDYFRRPEPDEDSAEVPEDSGEREKQGWKFPLHLLVNDPQIAATTVDLLTRHDLYKLSQYWVRHEMVSEPEEKRLGGVIPRLLTLYKSKVVESLIAELKIKLERADLMDSEALDILQAIDRMNELRQRTCTKLSRILL